MTHDEILELSYRAMRDEGASAEECIERFLRPHPLTPSPSHGEGESVEEIAEQIRALEGPLEFRRSVAVAPSAGERKAAMLRSLGQPRQGWLERLVASPVRGGLVALLALTVVGASTAGAANVGGVRDSIGEALGLVQPEGECAGSLPADEVAVCSWGQAFGTSTPAIADPTLDGVQAVAIGREHTLALLEDGTLLAWGSDEYGQLGNGPGREDSLEPVEVPGLEDVTDIAAGDYHSIALLLDGTVVVWGQNDFGQLGTGDFGSFDQEGLLERHVIEESPRGLTGLTGVVDVAAGGVHSLLLRADGTVAEMGIYLSEEPGQAVGQAKPLPTSVSGVSNAAAIASGANHNLALLSDGQVVTWGSDEQGQLGDGEQTSSTVIRTPNLRAVTQIAAGGNHSLALVQDGTVRAWGADQYGQLGEDDELAEQSSPAEVEGLLDVVAVAAGESHSLALLRDGSARAWGRGASGQLGNGSEDDRPTPVRVEGLRGVEALFGGGD
ncbi:MAG TPA: hypothetical protein VFZ12_08900, partial [Dehalococcoidia bacterium]|nr:hypothetical protein [Dehalococcoidia bacterium]